MANENAAINASPSAIFELISNLNNSIKIINDLNNNLALSLKRLGATFQDQEYLTVQDYVSKTQKSVEGVIPHFKIVANCLFEYADLLDKSRSAIGGTAQPLPVPLAQKAASESPQELPVNRMEWETDDEGNIIYNYPEETGKRLLIGRGDSIEATNGHIQCVNMNRLYFAKDDLTLQQFVEYAVPRKMYGDTPESRQKILEATKIQSSLMFASIDNIAGAVFDGRGVIAEVFSGKLWQDPSAAGVHPIMITGIKKDNPDGDVLGFFVCDSGRNGGENGEDRHKYYSTNELKNALTLAKLNVTTEPVHRMINLMHIATHESPQELSAITCETDKDENMIFNSPEETGKRLLAGRGDNTYGEKSDGLVACVNLGRLCWAKDTTEQKALDFFVRNRGRSLYGLSAKSRQEILAGGGIKSELMFASVYNIAIAVFKGRGVIAEVHSSKLWQHPSETRTHAITITGLKTDRYGNLLGFFVCDSGRNGGENGEDHHKYYSANEIKMALTGESINVTTERVHHIVNR